MAAAPPSARSADEWVGRRGGHGIGHVAHLERHRLDAGAGQLGAAGAAGEAGDDAAGVGVPLRAAEAGERGHERHAAAVGDRRGQRADLGGRGDDAEAVAQPLDGGAGDERRPLERVGDAAVRVVGVRRRGPRPADGEAVGRGRTVGAGVGQREAARAVGDLDHARLEAGLAEECGLLVAEDARDRDAVEDGRRRGRGRRARRCRSGRPRGAPRAACASGTPKRSHSSGDQASGRGVEEERAAGVGGVGGVDAAVGPAGEVPQHPGVDGAEGEVRVVGAEGEVAVLEEPGRLGGAEVRVEDEAGRGADEGEMAGLDELARRAARCAGPARRWRGAAAGRCGGRRPPASRAGW